MLGGNRFVNSEELECAVGAYFEELDGSYYKQSVEATKHTKEKCIELNGDYVEKCSFSQVFFVWSVTSGTPLVYTNWVNFCVDVRTKLQKNVRRKHLQFPTGTTSSFGTKPTFGQFRDRAPSAGRDPSPSSRARGRRDTRPCLGSTNERAGTRPPPSRARTREDASRESPTSAGTPEETPADRQRTIIEEDCGAGFFVRERPRGGSVAGEPRPVLRVGERRTTNARGCSRNAEAELGSEMMVVNHRTLLRVGVLVCSVGAVYSDDDVMVCVPLLLPTRSSVSTSGTLGGSNLRRKSTDHPSERLPVLTLEIQHKLRSHRVYEVWLENFKMRVATRKSNLERTRSDRKLLRQESPLFNSRKHNLERRRGDRKLLGQESPPLFSTWRSNLERTRTDRKVL